MAGWFTYPFAWVTCTPITTPLVYSEDMSVAQQIAHLFGLFKEYQADLSGYVSKDDFSQFLEWLNGEEEAQTEILEQYTDQKIAALKDLIEELQIGALQWNVQKGSFTSSQEAQRDMFNDISIYALTVGELNALDLTVSSLATSDLTVRGLALYSGIYYNGADYINNGIIEKG